MFDPKVNEYISLLKEYNETTNIYSKRSYDHLPYHVQDSINIAGMINSRSKVHVDLGSGSGLPGVLISIMSDVEVICIESKERKRQFLEYAKEALDLDNLHVFNGDVQSFTKSYSSEKINSFSAKAFAKPPKLLMYLSMFRPHQYRSDAICYVPISERQSEVLIPFDTVDRLTVREDDFLYFKVRMDSFRSYKSDLKNQYNL